MPFGPIKAIPRRVFRTGSLHKLTRKNKLTYLWPFLDNLFWFSLYLPSQYLLPVSVCPHVSKTSRCFTAFTTQNPVPSPPPSPPTINCHTSDQLPTVHMYCRHDFSSHCFVFLGLFSPIHRSFGTRSWPIRHSTSRWCRPLPHVTEHYKEKRYFERISFLRIDKKLPQHPCYIMISSTYQYPC